jgi:hypothetical protein
MGRYCDAALGASESVRDGAIIGWFGQTPGAIPFLPRSDRAVWMENKPHMIAIIQTLPLTRLQARGLPFRNLADW